MMNYALALEHLGSAFYQEGLNNFTASDFAAAGFHEQVYGSVIDIANEEAEHVEYLTSKMQVAGLRPIEPCTYTFGVTTAHSFVATAASLKAIGVSAYLSHSYRPSSSSSETNTATDTAASTNTNTSETYRHTARSILDTETRHNNVLRKALQRLPSPSLTILPPNSSADIPLALGAPEIFTLLSPYIASCPTSNLPLQAYSRLSLARYTRWPMEEQETIMLESPERKLGVWAQPDARSGGDGKVTAKFVTGNVTIWGEGTVFDGGSRLRVKVPEGVRGVTYLAVVQGKGGETVAGPVVLEVGSWWSQKGCDGA